MAPTTNKSPAMASGPAAISINTRGPMVVIRLEDVDQEKDAGAALVTTTGWVNPNTCGYYMTAPSAPVVCGSPSLCATNTDNFVGCTMAEGPGAYNVCLNKQDSEDGKCDGLNEFETTCCAGTRSTECATLVWTEGTARTMFQCVKTGGITYVLDEPLAVMQSTAAGGGDGATQTLSVTTSKGSYSFPTSSTVVVPLTASGGIGDDDASSIATTTRTDHSTTTDGTKSITITSVIVSSGTVGAVSIAGTTDGPLSSALAHAGSNTTVDDNDTGDLSGAAKLGISVAFSVLFLLVTCGLILWAFKKRSAFYQHAGIQLQEREPQNNSNNNVVANGTADGTAAAPPQVAVAPVDDNNHDGAEDLANNTGVVPAAAGDDHDDNNNNAVVAQPNGSAVAPAAATATQEEAPPTARGTTTWEDRRARLLGLFQRR